MEINSNIGLPLSEPARSDTGPADSIGRQAPEAHRTGRRGAALSVSIDSGNQALELLYRTALNKLSEVLAEDGGANVLRDALSSDAERNPTATAQRILTLATAYLPAYLRQYPTADGSTVRREFADLIGDGIEQGFVEARQILQGLGVLEGDIAADVDRTREQVLQGLEAFRDAARPVRVNTGD